MASEQMGFGAITACLMVYDIIDVMDNDNFATALDVGMQVSIIKACRVKKHQQPTILAKRWGISYEKGRKINQVTAQWVVRTMVHPSLSSRSRTNDCML